MKELTTLPELLKYNAQKTPHKTIYWVRNEKRKWQPILCADFYKLVVNLAWQINDLGVRQYSRIAIIAPTCYEWELVHHAALMAGCTVIGIDPSETPEQTISIARLASIQALFVSSNQFLSTFTNETQFQLIVEFGYKDTLKEPSTKLKYLNLLKTAALPARDPPLLDNISSKDIATIIFTSGTTGIPKGIEYSHDQFLEAISSILDAYPQLSANPCYLICWLPLANIFQRMVNLCAIACGAEVFFVTEPRKIFEYIPEINPHIFIAVPRFYEKLYQSLENRIDQMPKFAAFFSRLCLELGENNSNTGKLFRLLNQKIFLSFTSIFGKNILYLISGSAPMPVHLLKKYNALGLLILEGYGLSEDIIPVAVNRPDSFKFGSVGTVTKGSRVKLANDTELLVSGAGISSGYLGHEDQDHNVDAEGYLATGDYARIDSDGFIWLTGRKSEVFKTSTGRKISPVEIETLLKKNKGIEHAVIFGENKKFLVGLITITSEYKNDDTNKTILHCIELANRIKRNTEQLPDYKQPAGLIISFTELSITQSELTSNLKLRRKNIQKNYQHWLDQIYLALEAPESEIHAQPLVVTPSIVLLKT